MQIYGVFAQLPISPVAYVPAESLSAGYRVMAELSRGWAGPTVPFVQEAEWELRREVVYPQGAVLYAEGIFGEIAVWQGTRLLYVGSRPWVWVPLVGAGRAELRLTGANGGIGGGVYLLARNDTVGWPAEPWPAGILPPCTGRVVAVTREGTLSAETLRAAVATGGCVAVPFLPPARVRQALLPSTCLCQGPPKSSPAPIEPISPMLLVLLLGLIGGASGLFPALRVIRWKGLLMPLPVNFLEAAVGLSIALAVSWGILGAVALPLWGLLWLFVGVEAFFFALQGISGHWAWQSWEGLWLLGLVVQFLYPNTFWGLAGAAWLLRAARLTLKIPSFAYLCSAEYFVYLLLSST